MSTATARQQTSIEERNAATVHRVLKELWEGGNLAIADEVFPPEFIRHDPAGDHQGAEGYKEAVREVRKGFPDLTMEIHQILPVGDKVAFHTTMHATHTGEFSGLKPTGIKIAIQTFCHVRFDDAGMCVDAYVLSDYMTFAKTLFKKMSWWQRLSNLPAMIKQLC